MPVHESSRVSPVLEMRVVVTAADYQAAVAFYRETLGLPLREAFSTPNGEGMILEAGMATLEILDEEHAAFVDSVEVGRRVAPPVRLAFEVTDTERVTTQLVDGGATLLAPPVTTPWSSVNSRLDGAAGLQLTIFSEEH